MTLRVLLLLPLFAVLVACSRSEGLGESAGGVNVGDVPAAEWQPLPPAPAVSTEVQAARDRILGPEATDPATVKLWWYGVSSFIASAGGHLFLFDAWESVGLQEDYVPIGREELVAIQPEAILIGHGHFDHAADAGYVAGHTGAALVAGQTVCNTARERAAQLGAMAAFPCVVLGSRESPGPGALQQLRLWRDLPPLRVLQHIHSAVDPSDLLTGGLPLIFVPQVLSFLEHLNTDPREIAGFVQSLTDDGLLGQPEGGTWAYHLRVGDFSLLWHDSTGPIGDEEPQGPAVQAALDGFPGCVDVQVGAIVGFGMVTSGLRDSTLYVASAHPQLFLPSHHDAWAPVLGGGAAAYETQWRNALASLENPPELDYLRDPEDYMKPRVFRVDDPRWKVPMPGSSCAG
ncbi:MBL fold metallo-hydrolase [Solimonas sp. SE-A11]|uniref:MBL fold metallo-hydrolase n=1 Tax=Solimonas sp. SE-A11 TaxID=3054954 RepID=UPI00259CFCFE|nr:MBL fold metallo-hydrolase [Solimonas sp. SE-A11]MDM4770673.1 MBL fold metallo-hydrolase [Solimonas sp. SE-A11]